MNPALAKTLSITASSALLIGALAFPAHAWSDHRLLTREILGDTPWLSNPQFRQIEVTPYSYTEADRSAYAPEFQPIYIDRLVGEKTTAREILLRYVDEPNWGMDEGLDLSPFQDLAGGSKGYRHQRYHYLKGVVQVGIAHERAETFYQLAKLAFAKGDAYWGFRFLARSLHYLEDLGQPLHTRPFRLRQILGVGFSLPKLKILAGNYHHYYEAWVSNRLSKQQKAGAGNWVMAIREADPAKVHTAKDAAKALAAYSNKHADRLLEVSESYWPSRVKRTDAIAPIDFRLLDPPTPPRGWETLDKVTTNALHVTAKVSKGFLAFAYSDAIAPSRPKTPDSGWGGLDNLD